MTSVRISVIECYGNDRDNDGEESVWGPYISYAEIDKDFGDLGPLDFVEDGEIIEYEDLDESFSFDLYQRNIDEDGTYCRFNFWIVKEAA